MIPFAVPYFWESCAQFGLDDVFYRIHDNPEVYEALLKRMHQHSLGILKFFLERSKGYVDILLLWDDFAGQHGMMVNPEWWRKTIKPYLRTEIMMVHDNGQKVFFHSCGAVRPVINDLIEIGVDALTVFQINAKDMDPKSISREFGGRMCFYGGLDVQQLLSYGTVQEVESQVRYNVDCFRDCGGYIVSNCHSHINTVRGENIVAMCRTANSSTQRIKG
jgi:uroporphyrinogen decarboxylase